ncbi:hypothetical protein [Chondrinema litorale]|uniref:hypothetical protein n=1 Tax=Chondrinema litorale TaxID=2994555 RepID=UPI002543C72C|nr:hypothetical protein [Chondrinema litorale]UZR96611.1 hypothetical protein OQ292_20905 [Chondrinema litorale]
MPVEASIKTELKRSSGSTFATIYVEQDNDLIYIDWDGFLSVDQVKEGSEELLKIFKTVSGISKILVNNQKVTGPWSKANDWYVNDWNPRAIKAGLKFMAVIESENIFTQLSLQGFQKVTSGFETQRFIGEDKARTWLKSA